MLGNQQLCINHIKITIGLRLMKFNRKETVIEYEVNDLERSYFGWIDERLLKNCKKLKIKKDRNKMLWKK